MKMISYVNQNHLFETRLKLPPMKNLNIEDKKGLTYLMHASSYGNIELVKCLLEKGADVNYSGSRQIPPLSYACARGQLEAAMVLLQNGANVNQTNDRGETPVTVAVKSSRLNIIQCLIGYNCDVCKSELKGVTPLEAAVQINNKEIAKYLLENGAQRTVYSAFLKAMALGNNKIAQFLVTSAVHVQPILSEEKESFLLQCVKNSNTEMLQFLVQFGLDVNRYGSDGYTPLTKAVELENFPIVKYLIERGAKFNLRDSNGRLALSVAASKGSFQIVKYLIEAGADVRLAEEEIEEFAKCNKNFGYYIRDYFE